MINLKHTKHLLNKRGAEWLQMNLHVVVGLALVKNIHGDEFQIALRYSDIVNDSNEWKTILSSYYWINRCRTTGIIY